MEFNEQADTNAYSPVCRIVITDKLKMMQTIMEKKIMKFRKLTEEMQEEDFKEVLEIIYPYTTYCGYKRMEGEIKVFFKLHGKIKSCVLLPDQVEDMPDGMQLSCDEQYEYRKYMVAKGFSELWVNNRYGDD